MLTTCPKCSHTFSHQPCCPPPPTPLYVNQAPPGPGPVGISVSLHLPASGGAATVAITTSDAATPSVTVTTFPGSASARTLASMAGGGLVMPPPAKCPAPLAFALPPPAGGPPPAPAGHGTTSGTDDLEGLAATLAALRTSGWYYEDLSWQESADLLRPTPPGTFLVRDSSDPRFLFSLSVQTDRGPMSVRLHYVCGRFRFDADPRLAPRMPLFDCVVKLVEHYIVATRGAAAGERRDAPGKDQVWVDASGQMYSHILLTAPLYRRSQLPSLQHLARLAINEAVARRASQAVRRLPLPPALQDYLAQYPYSH